MGKDTKNRNIVLLSGFEINDNNRGSAALGYGSIAFLREKGYYTQSDKLCMIYKIRKKFWGKKLFNKIEYLKVAEVDYPIQMIPYLPIELTLYIKYRLYCPITPFGKMINNLTLVAATNGGDGFSDIYGYPIFINRLKESQIAMAKGKKLIFMPQTLGPFTDEKMKSIAKNILFYASPIYLRDKNFTAELDKMGVAYEIEKDLSAFMPPEPWDITIEPGSIGINVSGLAYFNKYRALAGKFENYPQLILRIIDYFQRIGKKIYLIPHSYNYLHPEYANDDLEAIKDLYTKINNQSNIILVDRDMTSPQIKYVISKMFFFIGTRMHANFAAIYTHVPVFGLAYSYKFAGAFEANGLSQEQVAMITSIKKKEVEDVLERIKCFYKGISSKSIL